MSWFKSRYTASMEQQIADLKLENTRLREQNDEMTGLILNRLIPGEVVSVGIKPKAVLIDKKELPRAGNWLKTRAALESQDQIITEYEPDKEKSANGSR